MTTAAQLTCRSCGRFPAQVFPIRRHVGMILMQRFVKLRVPLCREHALFYTKQFLLKTLWQGWWGYISFFVNWFVVVADLVILVKAGKMAAPMAAPPVAAPTESPYGAPPATGVA
jgi:hypothetical protein